MKINAPLLILLFAELILVPSLVGYLLNSQGISTDTPGHAAESLIYRDQILPNIYGWNSYFFFGYPIASYPPLSHMVIGLLSYFTGAKMATKIALVLSYLVLPATVYLFLNKHMKNRFIAACATLALSVYILFTNMSLFLASLSGGLLAGLVANYFALPLFFLALMYYPEKKKEAVLLSFLVVITNIAVAAGLVVCIIIIELINLYANGKIEFRRAINYFFWTTLISSFWLIPFIFNQMGIHATDIAKNFDFDPSELYFIGTAVPYIITALICFAVLYLCWKTKDKNRESTFFIVIIIATLMYLGVVPKLFLISVNSDYGMILPLILAYPFSALYLLLKKQDWIVIFHIALLLSFLVAAMLVGIIYTLMPDSPLIAFGVHIYRLQFFLNMFEVLVVGAAFGAVVEGMRNELRTLAFAVAGVFIMIIAASTGAVAYTHPDESEYVYDFSFSNATGRALIFDSSIWPAPQAAQFGYFFTTGKPIAGGLFFEEAGSSVTNMDFLCDSVSTEIGTWGAFYCNTRLNVRENLTESIKFYSRLLWVSDIILDENVLEDENTTFPASDFPDRYEINSGNKTFVGFKVSESEVVEVVDPIRSCENNWEAFVKDWYRGGVLELYYHSCAAEDWDGTGAFAARQEQISQIHYSNGKVAFRFESAEALPVIFKEAYSPNWKAYANGEPVKIYKITPSFMLIFLDGDKEVEIRYEVGWLEYGSVLISLGGIILLFLSDKTIRKDVCG